MALHRLCAEDGEVLTPAHRALHERRRDAARGSRQARGYGADHRSARAELERTLPAPCGYCGRTIYPGERFDAAHVVDGEPAAGYVAAHPRCNQAAKVRRS